MALGKNIRMLRELRGYTLERLSELSGVDVGTISALEVRDSARSKYAPAIARALNVSLEELMDGRALQEEKGGGMRSNVVPLKRTPDEVLIQQYETGGAMGHGLELRDQRGVSQSRRVTSQWLEGNVKTDSGTQNLAIVTGFGGSVQPLFNPRDPLLVDIGL